MNVKKVYPASYRNPKCSRCKNHGSDAKMKGHKGFCPYILCDCIKCILVEERRRINRQQNLLRRYPDINVKDIFKGCIRCEKFCQQVTDYSNCVTADSFMPSPNAYPVVQQINGNQSMPSVNLQMPSTQPPPSHIYSSSPQPDFGYYTPKTPFAIFNYPAATSSKMSDVHSSNSNISSSSSSSSSNSSSSPTTTTTTTTATTTSASNTMYYTPVQVATDGMPSSEFSPSYIYPGNGCQLAQPPQNLGFGNYNRPSLFWNTFNYPVNSWLLKFCDNSVPSNADNFLKSCKFAADTTK
ncbi:doublesex- and mab-3-related transcription factor 1-like [Octopus sinensis]|uniref:Doublesex- and mab-3-related transcription factor 1-like n=1 Tax=Octopus sinensis TaxID=2607531 RepID=A0A6P7TDN1_9MOLL|nr:doublesex- and mab-3-related transcription factor 1-like [Octopus sinensis]